MSDTIRVGSVEFHCERCGTTFQSFSITPPNVFPARSQGLQTLRFVPIYREPPLYDSFFDEAVDLERRLGLLTGLPARTHSEIGQDAIGRLLDRDSDGTRFVLFGRERCPNCANPEPQLATPQPPRSYVELDLIVAPHERWDSLTEAERERESTAATRAAIADHKLRMR
jgi:hypothetical protein